MSLKKDVTYLPPYQDKDGNIYEIVRAVVSKSSTDNLLGSEMWNDIDTTYALGDGTELTTDDAEDTFVLNTKPPKLLGRVTPRV